MSSQRRYQTLQHLLPALLFLAAATSVSVADEQDCDVYRAAYTTYTGGCFMSDTGWWIYGDRAPSWLARDTASGVGQPRTQRFPTTTSVAATAGDVVYMLSRPQYPEPPVVGVLDWSCKSGLPRAVGALPVDFSSTPSSFRSMLVTDQSLWVRATVVGSSDFTHRFDINDPLHPISSGSTDVSGHEILESGGLLFLLGWPTTIIDPTISDSIAVIGSIDFDQSVKDLAHIPPYVATISGDSIQLFDISVPASPVPLGATPTAATELEPGPNVIFALGDSLHVLDWHDRQSPTTLAAIDIPGIALDASFDPARNAILVAAGEEGAYTIDVSLPSAPTLQWREPERESFTPNQAFGTSNRVYLVSGDTTEAFTVVDATNLDDPRWSGVSPDGPSSCDVVAHESDRYAYTIPCGAPGRIDVWNVGDWATPFLESSVATEPFLYNLLIDGSILYAAARGLQSFDITDPSTPIPLAFLPFNFYVSNPCHACVDAGDRKLVVAMDDSVRVVDVTDPGKPELVFKNQIDDVPVWGGCAGKGSFVFAMAERGDQLWSIDFSVPEAPRVAYKMILEEGEGMFHNMTIDGDWLYTAPSLLGDPLPSLHVLRIDTDGALREVARHQLFAETWALAAKQGHVLIGGDYGFGWLVDESRATSIEPGLR